MTTFTATGVVEIVAAIRLRREIQGEWLLILGGLLVVLAFKARTFGNQLARSSGFSARDPAVDGGQR